VEKETMMKVTLNAKKFSDVLSIVKGMMGYSVLPILNELRLEAREGSGLVVACTDLLVQMELPVPSVVEVPGLGMLSPQKALKAIGSWKGEMAIESEGLETRLEIDEMVSAFAICPVADYPELAKASGPLVFEMPKALLLRGLEKAGYAQSKDDTRPHLSCLHVFGHEKHGLVFESTDGHRAVRWRSGMTVEPVVDRRTEKEKATEKTHALDDLLPMAGHDYLLKFVRAFTGPFQYYRSEEQPLVRIVDVPTGAAFTVKTIESQFPTIDQVTPVGGSLELVVQAEAMAKVALRFMDCVKLELEEGASEMKMSSSDSLGSSQYMRLKGVEVRRAERLVEPEVIEKPEEDPAVKRKLVTGVNAKYLQEALKAMKGEVVIGFEDALDPFVMNDEDSTAVIMPMRCDG
jgi:DNA polymerase III sliding clamp (beta) subunit (PCNA family)